MMREVLISIQPKWCELICKCIGWENQRPQYKKRLELRKTAPEPPFKCYIYCTKGKKENDKFWIAHRGNNYLANGKVIAEFTCNYVMNHCEMSNADMAERMSCVPRTEILKYANGKNVLGWHIDNLVIYDEPKELGEFFKIGHSEYCHYEYQMREKLRKRLDEYNARTGENAHLNTDSYFAKILKILSPFKITRPPQSWCYVEGGEL